jgi:restriction endonuclease Mrr
MVKKQDPVEGAQFVRYFGPLLDALRELGGSGAKSEVVEQVASDLELSEDVQNELLDSGAPRFQNQVARDGAPPIELVDGSKLIDMFMELELGVRRVVAYEVDESFFSEFNGG